jgi:hypothetical protein
MRNRVISSRVTYIIAALTLALYAFAPAAPAQAEPIVNELWSGHVTKRAPTTHVLGWWEVPRVECNPGESSNAGQWVGLGGVNEPLVQAGVVSGCLAGQPVAFAFYQTPPSQSSATWLLQYLVASGDNMEAEISYLGGNQYQVRLADAGLWEFNQQVTQPDLSTVPMTAEWIVEGAGGQPLSNFGTVHFESAFLNNRLLASGDTNVFLQDVGRGPKVTVSDISQFGGHGPNFDVTWVHS